MLTYGDVLVLVYSLDTMEAVLPRRNRPLTRTQSESRVLGLARGRRPRNTQRRRRNKLAKLSAMAAEPGALELAPAEGSASEGQDGDVATHANESVDPEARVTKSEVRVPRLDLFARCEAWDAGRESSGSPPPIRRGKPMELRVDTSNVSCATASEDMVLMSVTSQHGSIFFSPLHGSSPTPSPPRSLKPPPTAQATTELAQVRAHQRAQQHAAAVAVAVDAAAVAGRAFEASAGAGRPGMPDSRRSTASNAAIPSMTPREEVELFAHELTFTDAAAVHEATSLIGSSPPPVAKPAKRAPLHAHRVVDSSVRASPVQLPAAAPSPSPGFLFARPFAVGKGVRRVERMCGVVLRH